MISYLEDIVIISYKIKEKDKYDIIPL